MSQWHEFRQQQKMNTTQCSSGLSEQTKWLNTAEEMMMMRDREGYRNGWERHHIYKVEEVWSLIVETITLTQGAGWTVKFTTLIKRTRNEKRGKPKRRVCQVAIKISRSENGERGLKQKKDDKEKVWSVEERRQRMHRREGGEGQGITLFLFLVLWWRHAEGGWRWRGGGGVGGGWRGRSGEGAVKLGRHEDILLTLPSNLTKIPENSVKLMKYVYQTGMELSQNLTIW